ncbi:histidine phosphatase family protein [Aquibacillus sediminis]|uniref:histidine phosphatase family protein n=1 Tax=Aquibacillus sediminis TaxID=2574734 RepID=UPI001108B19E|nr:histidine phosphatase family protein [Aquibacillus sediminis]
MSTHVYFTRHGETVWNTKKLMQGWKDSPLTDKGINQARQLSHRCLDVPLDAIYSSTSDRAIQTAEIIKGERPLKVVKMDDLKELSFGSWEGKTFEENKRESPEEWLSFWETPHLFSNKSVEPFVNVQERMVKAVKYIVKQHPSESVLIVTHSIALKLLMTYFEKVPLENLWSTPPIPSASLTLININSEFYEVVYTYDTSHLEELKN